MSIPPTVLRYSVIKFHLTVYNTSCRYSYHRYYHYCRIVNTRAINYPKQHRQRSITVILQPRAVLPN